MRRRYALALARRMVRIQLLTELQYRTNLVMNVYQVALSLATSLTAILLVLNQVDDLNGWALPHLLVLIGGFTLVGGLQRMVARPNLTALVRDIHRGTLDYVLVKPVDTQLLVSIRRMEIWYGVDVLIGLGVIIWGVVELDHQVDPLDGLLFAGTLVTGVIIIYCFLFSLMSTSFWLVRVEELVGLFESVYQAGRWPVSIYPDWLRFGLTFIVPISFALTVPAEALTSRVTLVTVLLELAVAIAFVAFTRWFFRVAIQHYTGASA